MESCNTILFVLVSPTLRAALLLYNLDTPTAWLRMWLCMDVFTATAYASAPGLSVDESALQPLWQQAQLLQTPCVSVKSGSSARMRGPCCPLPVIAHKLPWLSCLGCMCVRWCVCMCAGSPCTISSCTLSSAA